MRIRLEAMQIESKNQTSAFQAQISAFQTQMQAMQAGFDSQLKSLTESVSSWKGLWEASTNEIRELKMEIKELRIEIDELKSEIDKLRTENAELKGQIKEHYKLA
jgi:chromosome segregation ATPase